jgi:hypothetical protein
MMVSIWNSPGDGGDDGKVDFEDRGAVATMMR